MTRDDARNKIIFAMDVNGMAEIDRWSALLAGKVGMFKIGKQLFTACGPAAVQMIQKHGGEVFLDLKYHDIPNTVAMACCEAAALGAQLFNLHALGGYEMMATTMETLHKNCGNERPKVLAVTVLTSSNQETLAEIGIDTPVKDQVVRLAKLAKRAGVDGVVASPQEIVMLKKAIRGPFVVLTPGVRPLWAGKDDQKRTMTPGEAVAAGADYIVVGRPVLKAADRRSAVEQILQEIDAGIG